MFVSTFAGSIVAPGNSARPKANARAFSWSSASRSTLWSSAFSPAAATMPACRSEPPIICLKRQASPISSRDDARHAPTGAPRPFEKSIHAGDLAYLVERPHAAAAHVRGLLDADESRARRVAVGRGSHGRLDLL